MDEKDLPLAEFFEPEEKEEEAQESSTDPSGVEIDVREDKSKPIPPKVALLRKMGKESSLPLKARLRFQAAVELDEMRLPEDRMGLGTLFEACCKQGTSAWLNPLDDLKPLVENLGKYNGKSSALRPFIFILVQLARGNISPATFVTHVMRPRMAYDAVWRTWRESHYWSLTAVADLLVEMKKNLPFQTPYLGKTKIKSEVALVKFVGRPLFRYPAKALENPANLMAYKKIWSSFSFSGELFINFMKVNVFPFLFRLSGRVDLELVLPVLRDCLELEEGFSRRFPQDISSVDLFSVNLSQDLETRLVQKEKDGQSPLDIITELREYLRLVKNLIRSSVGIYLGGFFAGLFRSLRDMESSCLLADLVGVVRDTGGLAALRWHGGEFIRRPQLERRLFLREVSSEGGLHASYPYANPLEVFPWPEISPWELTQLWGEWGGDSTKIGEVGDFQELFFNRYPTQRSLWDKVAVDIWEGSERLWNQEFIKKLDAPGPGSHVLLLKRLIPGIGQSGYAQRARGTNFQELWNSFAGPHKENFPEYVRDFTLETSPSWSFQNTQEEVIRPRLNLEAWFLILDWKNKFDESMGDFSSLIHKKVQEAESSHRALKESIINREIDCTQGEKKLKILEIQLQIWLTREKSLPDLTDDQKFFLLLGIASKEGNPKEPLVKLAFSEIHRRYPQTPELKMRENYLDNELPPEKLNLCQLELVIRWLEALSLDLQSGFKPPREDDLPMVLKPFALLTREEAFKKITGLGKMLSEMAKARELFDRLNKGSLTAQKFKIRLTKSAFDAYYGEMGGTILSSYPKLILRPGFFNLRLMDEAQKKIWGNGLLAYSPKGIPSLAVGPFFYFFGFNPLKSFLVGLSQKNWVLLWLNFRLLLEEVSLKTGKCIFLPGLGNTSVLSGSQELADLVKNYEKRRNPPKAEDAQGFHLHYLPQDFARGWVVIDPQKAETFCAKKDLENLGSL